MATRRREVPTLLFMSASEAVSLTEKPAPAFAGPMDWRACNDFSHLCVMVHALDAGVVRDVPEAKLTAHLHTRLGPCTLPLCSAAC